MEPYKIEEVWNENKEVIENVSLFLFGWGLGWITKKYCCC